MKVTHRISTHVPHKRYDIYKSLYDSALEISTHVPHKRYDLCPNACKYVIMEFQLTYLTRGTTYARMPASM